MFYQNNSTTLKVPHPQPSYLLMDLSISKQHTYHFMLNFNVMASQSNGMKMGINEINQEGKDQPDL